VLLKIILRILSGRLWSNCASATRMLSELSKVLVGQRRLLSKLLYSLFAGGHCLITARRIAKTLLVQSLAQILFEVSAIHSRRI